jgi:DNA polymerase III epsilon subunit-like protein
LAGRPISVVDVEGNGRQPPEIIEIAILPIDGRPDPGNLRTWLVKPRQSITGLVTRKVHGITNAEVADAPAWSAIASEVAALIGGRTIVAHNAAVEHRVLRAHLPSWRPPLILDTLRLAKHVWPGLPGYGLDRMVAHGRLDGAEVAGGYHRAGWDAWMTGQLLIALAHEAGLEWAELVDAAAPPEFRSAGSTGGGLW